jgi:type IV pilus assembly protein PilB
MAVSLIQLLQMMVQQKGSDLHVAASSVPMMRVRGDMLKVDVPPLAPAEVEAMVGQIITSAQKMELLENKSLDFSFKASGVGIFRVNVFYQRHGLSVVMRILSEAPPKLEDLNLPPICKAVCSYPNGLVLITGPTGSGKSTTLYSALQQIKDVTSNIITVEDPVEYHMEGVTQVPVNAAIGMSFANALRSILRQDPDTILIGEIRDHETADIAVKMALTGHMVFSSLHTNDASSAIARFIDIGIPPLLLASSLNLVVAQRLVRKICPRCKVPYSPPQEMIEQLGLDHAPDVRFHMGEGCVTCNGVGYQGRIGVFEMLNCSRDIKKLILKNASTMEIQDCAEREGMKTLRQAGIELVLKGETTIEQVLAATTEL